MSDGETGWQTNRTKSQRRSTPPFGIQAIAIILGFFGIFQLAHQFTLIFADPLIGGATFLWTLLGFASLIGLYQLKGWGYLIFMGHGVLGLIALLYLIVQGLGQAIIALVIYCAIIGYVYSWRHIYKV